MDTYSIGREVGQLANRVTKIETRMEAWKHLWRRIGMLMVLWTGVLIAGTNVDTASTLAASTIRKLVF